MRNSGSNVDSNGCCRSRKQIRTYVHDSDIDVRIVDGEWVQLCPAEIFTSPSTIVRISKSESEPEGWSEYTFCSGPGVG